VTAPLRALPAAPAPGAEPIPGAEPVPSADPAPAASPVPGTEPVTSADPAPAANPAPVANPVIGADGSQDGSEQVPRRLPWGRAENWYRVHKVSLIACGRVLAVVGIVSAWNLQGWPGRVDDDEGTYVAEAWAMIYQHHLSHYTYWYDHPPLGWAQLAAYIWLTGGFHWYPSAVMVGREFMWWVTLASSALLFVLCRRLEFRRTTAAVTVLAFGLSPLAVYYHRMVSLDNIGTMWLLAAMVIATSRRRSLAAAFWSAVCMAMAVLSKETLALLLPAVFWLLWQHSASRTRKWHLGVFAATFVELVAFYLLFAVLRGELIPGRGHVSLGWALWWQLMGRAGTGSVLDSHSVTHGLAVLWIGIDPWLVLVGVVLVPAGLLIRRLRPLALGMLIQVVLLIPGGYVPYFYVTAMLPFAALLVGGVADTLWSPLPRPGHLPGRLTTRLPVRLPARLPVRLEPVARYLRYAGRVPLAAAVVVLAAFVAPQGGSALVNQSKVDDYAGSLAATAWVEQNVPRHDVVVVDDYIWLDLKLAGMSPVWTQKTATDPETSKTELPHGWRSIQYIVMTSQLSAALAQLPTVEAAVRHSVPVKSFADGVTVLRVVAG
jgi:4-amino-4-deoxy-L-arabinose transferase-like glycosyltransferase